MNRTEFIGADAGKIQFVFNGSQIKFGDQTPVETYFKNAFNSGVMVICSLSGNWSNWTKEEEEQIEKEIEKIKLEIQDLELSKFSNLSWSSFLLNYHNEKEITVKFNKKNSIIKIKLSNQRFVAELIDEYFKKSNTSNAKFTFNGQILSPMDTSFLYEVGLDDNSEIIVS